MTTERTTAPFGSWRSPITSDLIVAETVSLGEVELDGSDIYWCEGRSAEGGRSVVVRRQADGTTLEMTPAPWNVRTRVHEYGGGAYWVREGTLYFSSFADDRLYRVRAGSDPEAVTQPGPWRYADGVIDARHERIICVREDHSDPSEEPVNAVVGIDLTSGDQSVLISGNDFYSTPRLSSDGTRLAWLTWNHPNLPWDGCELHLAKLEDNGAIGKSTLIAGGQAESIFQPEWSADGSLYFVSDRSGWWNLYRWRNGSTEAITQMEAEFGRPQWVFGLSTYSFAGPHTIVASFSQNGMDNLACIDVETKGLRVFDLPYCEITDVHSTEDDVVFVGGTGRDTPALIRLQIENGVPEVLRRSSNVELDERFLSVGEPIEFPTEGGRTAHAFFYPPVNADYRAPDGELPPLIVRSHGGPTGATSATLRLHTQYWTSRGFAILDVNYGGSSGYGRAYRQRLEGQWGVVDLDDCVNGARYLAGQKRVDAERLIITGGSAGGYTTLCAITFRDTFAAGTSYYGIGDLESFVGDTHKFESRYLERLVGPYPERRDIYQERSPIRFADRIRCPVLLFQGVDDKVVPPNQAETMLAALRERNIPCAYIPFEGEGHGFRRADSIKRSLDAELDFYSRVLRFELPEAVDPIPTQNLASR